jgi:hypothetical protein
MYPAHVNHQAVHWLTTHLRRRHADISTHFTLHEKLHEPRTELPDTLD